jgi:uncharacterized coiled-coil DUF342 family protein
MGHSEHEKLRSLSMGARYVRHLEGEVNDLRKLRDEMRRDMDALRAEVGKLRAELWKRGMTVAQYRARAVAERKNAEGLFAMLVELEHERVKMRTTPSS